MNNGEISDGRKTTYYCGLGLVICGVLLFVVSFASVIGGCGAQRFQGENNSFLLPGGVRIQEFDQRASFSFSLPLGFLGGFAGMVMIVGGAFLMNIGRRGVAGSGLVLDPKGAREDLKPWNKATGGMIQDALEETTLVAPKEAPNDFDVTLRKLHQLYKDGILSEAEYSRQKEAVLKKMAE